MTSMIGVWKTDPKLTTGHDEFGLAMGMTTKEIDETRDYIYTVSINREGDEWPLKVDIENIGTWIDIRFRMDVPFNWEGLDKSKNTSVISLKNDRFVEKVTSEKNGVVIQYNIEFYRDGDFLIATQTRNGKTETSKMRKV